MKRKNGTEIPNQLRDKIMAFNIEYLYGGGYYCLEMIPDPENNQILDIYIIMEDVKKFETMQKLRTLFDIQTTTMVDRRKHHYEAAYNSARSGNKSVDEPYDFTFSEIKDSLNGCARIVTYEAVFGDCYSKDVSLLQVQKIEEGMFKNGEMHGYCRHIDGNENIVQFGEFHNGVPHGQLIQYDIDIPEGKYQAYDINKTFEAKEGLYEKGHCVKLCKIKEFN